MHETFIHDDTALPPSRETRADFVSAGTGFDDRETFEAVVDADLRAAVLTADELDALARATGYRSGKWVMTPDRDAVDRYWRGTRDAVASGTLPTAKASTRRGSAGRDSHVVCAYTADYLDRNTVAAAGQALTDRGLVLDRYKPNVYTALGIYPETVDEWGVASEYRYAPDEELAASSAPG